MDRIFLDANVLFSAAYHADSGLLAFWRLRDFTLCSSRYAIEEARINLEEETQRRRQAQLTPTLQIFDTRERELPPSIKLPRKDVPILLAAMEAQATHLVTGDIRHFGPYFGKTVQGVLVVTPAEYLKLREKTGDD
ncbi:MAG TPA: PIN domain-containing protein [Candidatus Acidoferrum sp.]|nr:PIN domain-containing protein [Candidatus Acidoferrum sp.]